MAVLSWRIIEWWVAADESGASLRGCLALCQLSLPSALPSPLPSSPFGSWVLCLNEELGLRMSLHSCVHQ